MLCCNINNAILRHFRSQLLAQTDKKSKKNLALHELHNTFFSLKSNKWPEYDDISSNIVKAASNEVFSTTKQLFNISLKRRFSRQTQDCLCHSYF